MAIDRNQVQNQSLLQWVDETAAALKPKDVYWCDGSSEEYNTLMQLMVDSGMATPLSREGSHLFRSDPTDVARIEARTYISTTDPEEVGPTNNWIDPTELKKTMGKLYDGCMRGRTMYVIPFVMGPVDSPMAKVGIEITDSPYVVCNMHIMTRVGIQAIEKLGTDGEYIPCLHSIGAPLEEGQKDVPWPCAPIEDKYISHFTEENLIWSYGSGYGGNALLGKKCLALRIASTMARREGWMAEHMLILRLTSPSGKQYHIAGAFPSACGKTNLAMLEPTIPGWKCECVGDDIAWMKIGDDGRLHAINPEAGFFGVAPGTSYDSNPKAMDTITKNSIFTNCALKDDGDIWWEGIDGDPPAHAIDWKGQDWTPEGSDTPASNPNARFTAPAEQCPVISPDWESPQGVPIDIFIFGGRRTTVAPLVVEATDWDHGVFLGATASSETTAANIGSVGNLRYDPMAMLPFCAYNMGDYFQHWLEMGDKLGDKAPKVFRVNWFRKTDDGEWLWPGFGENSRVLKWMCDRLEGDAAEKSTPIGVMPELSDFDIEGLDISDEMLSELMRVDVDAWLSEVPGIREHLERFADHLPARITKQLDALEARLKAV
jgi:phosphoenolpyruvate carboxykinase (GTP)